MARFICALLAVFGLHAGAVNQNRPSPPLAPVVAEQDVGKLPLRLNLVSGPSYRQCEAVRFKLFLKNISNVPLPLEVARNIPEYDVVVRDGEGRVVWTCSGEKMIVRLSMNEIRTLVPGQTWTYTCEWDQMGPGHESVPRGEYVASGFFTVNEKNLRSTSRRITLR